ncbi:MAG: PAS domain-containing sensor histidine kinase [Bacteroidetes bacterium]|nr:PAS domain-containing sensor histidine kinase [Bacteroidota bacterium]
MNDQARTSEELLKELREFQKEYDALKATYENTLLVYKKAEERLKANEYILKERIKELNGIYSLSQAIEKTDNYEDVYRELVKVILPESMQFPDKVYALLVIENKKYCNLDKFNFTKERQHLLSPVVISGKQAGELIVAYTDDSPFIDVFEQKLITGFAERISKFAERKKSEEKLAESELKYRILIENTGEGIGIMNDEETFVFANPSAEKIFGVEKGKLPGLCLYDFLLPKEIEEIKNETRKRSLGNSSEYELEIFLKDGGRKDLLVTATPSFEGSKFKGTFGIFRDITERKSAEKQITLKNEELRKINAEKDKLFSIIAHDLRSPFNVFLNYTRILEEDLTSLTQDQIQLFVQMMGTSATNLYRLLENLLEWSRLQRGLTTLDTTSFLLLPNVSSSLDLVRESAHKKEIEININIPENLVVYADEKMLDSILRNLSSNAIKFTPKGGRITITAKDSHEGWIEISMKDTGIGMTKEMIDTLFKMDVNTNRKGTEGEPSTGLGLILCKEFVEKQGGRLWVESEVEKGSTFYFTLPDKI